MCMASLIILSFSFLRRFVLVTEEKKAAKKPSSNAHRFR